MGGLIRYKMRTMRALRFIIAVNFMLFMLSGLARAQSEWLTWGHDPERTGSNPDEKTLNKDNVSQLEVKWTAQISTVPQEQVLSTMIGSRGCHCGEYRPQGPGGASFS